VEIIMILKSIKYKNVSDVRSIEGPNYKPLNLGQINLIVGQNASGKTRAIEVIKNIGNMVSGNDKLVFEPFTKYELVFAEGDYKIHYYLYSNQNDIMEETLEVNGHPKLKREYGKEGFMYYEKERDYFSFKLRNNELAVTKGDSEQQPFFDKLYEWGTHIAHYKFGGQMGRNVAVEGQKERVNSLYINIPEIGIKGREVFGEIKFDTKIINDMSYIGYDIQKLDFQNKHTPFFTVEEKGVMGEVFHNELSQGMFRALSLIIQLNYSLLSNQPSLILIDDIGEGLDYERSKKLIDLMIKKIEGTQVQLIMTTNDRFVMNKVPLKYWQVIKREKNKSVFYNYENSKQTFDDFALTGLSNFDFFATEFFVKGFDEYVKVNP